MFAVAGKARGDVEGRGRALKAALLRTSAWAAASALVVGGVAVVGSPAVVPASGASAPHVMVVMMENKNFGDVIGQSDQPFTNSLASRYGLATQSYAFGHPSLPNYLTIVSGSNQGVTDDNDPSSHTFPGVKTIADQLAAAGFTARAYAENLPGNPATNSGEYAVRHVPWEYFPNTDIALRDASTIWSDLNGVSPPDFVWYTPNLINDEHDGTVQQGEKFLSSFIPAVQNTAWYRQGGQVIIEWDESDNDNSGINGGDGGHVPTIVVSAANAARPVKDSTRVDTAGILRSIEARYGLAGLGNAGNTANGNISSLLTTSSGGGQAGSFTNGTRATGRPGAQFSFSIRTTGSTTPRLKKHGRLPRGLHFLNNHNGTATIFGTPNVRDALGTYPVTIVATFGKGKTKQTMSQVLSITLSG